MNVNVKELLGPAGLVIAAILSFIGGILKGLTSLKNEYIPFILIFLGIAFCSGLAHEFCIESVIQGIIAAWASIGAYESVFKKLYGAMKGGSKDDLRIKNAGAGKTGSA